MKWLGLGIGMHYCNVLTSLLRYVCVCVCQETIQFDDWYILSLSVWLAVHVHLCVWINFLIHFCSHSDVAPSVSHTAQATLNHLGNEIVSTHHQTDCQMTKIRSDLKELIVGSTSAHIYVVLRSMQECAHAHTCMQRRETHDFSVSFSLSQHNTNQSSHKHSLRSRCTTYAPPFPHRSSLIHLNVAGY